MGESAGSDPRKDALAGVPCVLCGNRNGNQVFAAREMMFGTRVPGRYAQCGACGCLALLPPHPDGAAAYPPGYYSFEPEAVPVGGRVRAIKSLRTWAALRLPVALAERAANRGLVRRHAAWFAGLGVRPGTSVLDVGAGSGTFLVELYGEGFRDLTGIDRYINADREVAPGAWVRRGEIDQVARRFQLITMNHVLEHVEDQRTMLAAVRDRLAPGGALLVRTPLADSDAWETYQADWVSLDCPRHLLIHTERSLRRLASDCGLAVTRTFRDSVGMQFWGSEQYRRGIALMSDDSQFRGSEGSSFSEAEIVDFEAAARRLNREDRGDWAGFVLQLGRQRERSPRRWGRRRGGSTGGV